MARRRTSDSGAPRRSGGISEREMFRLAARVLGYGCYTLGALFLPVVLLATVTYGYLILDVLRAGVADRSLTVMINAFATRIELFVYILVVLLCEMLLLGAGIGISYFAQSLDQEDG